MRKGLRVLAAFALAIAFACDRSGTTDPLMSTFPDSVRVSQGLPPIAFDGWSTQTIGDTVILASLRTDVASLQQAMHVDIEVIAYDTSASPLGRNLPIGTCPLSLRIYRGTDRSVPPAWESDKAAPAVRCPTLQSLGRSSTDIMASWDAGAILGDSLPVGQYSFGYTLRTTDGRAFEFSRDAKFLSTDRVPPTSDLSAIHFEARTQIVDNGPRMLKTVVVAKNMGTRAVRLNYGDCNLTVRLYRTPDRASVPVWRYAPRGACPSVLNLATVQPGDSLLFRLSVPMYDVVADGLPTGVYLANAEISLSGGTRAFWSGGVNVTGEPDRLPSSRNVDGLMFTATTRLVHGAGGADTIRTLVLVTNTTNTRRIASVPGSCPLFVYAYTSAAVRDAVPLQQPISYAGTKGCSVDLRNYALDPGQSWVFGRDVPASAAAGLGHLWFTVWMPGTPALTLAAGDVEVPR